MKLIAYQWKGRTVRARNKEDAARKFVGTKRNHLGNDAIPHVNSMMKQIQRVKPGFTLIELLIIIAIIGIIASIAIPKFREIIKNNRQRNGAYRAEPQPAAQYTKWKLQNGEEVECEDYRDGAGYIDLSGCRDGKRYYAQINVARIN